MNKAIDLVNGNIKTNIVKFAIPIALSGILQLLFSQTDIIVCRYFGSEFSVPAISGTNSFVNFMLNFVVGFSVGANVCISNAVGAKDKEKGERVIGTSMIFGLVSSIFIAILSILITKPALKLLNADAQYFDLSVQYLQIYFAGVPFIVLYDFASALLRGMGDSKRPFYFLTAAGVLNVGLNLLFVIAFNMDVAGVAWATTISQGVAAILCCIVLIKSNLFANFHWKNCIFRKVELVEVIKVGVPASIQSSFFSISNLIIQSSINGFGTDVTTGSGAGASIESYLNTAQNAFGQACIAFVAANYGAHNIKNIKSSFRWCLIYAVGISAILSVVSCLLRYPLLSLFANTPESMEVGSIRVLINCGSYVLYALTDCPPYAERGMKYSFIPMLISLIGICGSRLLFIFTLFQLPQFHTPMWLFLTYPISWVLTGVAHLIAWYIISKKTFAKIEADAKLAVENN